MATPAPLYGAVANCGRASSCARASLPTGAAMWRLGPVSQKRISPVAASVSTYLYSNEPLVSREICHQGKRLPSIGMAFFHSPRALQLPVTASAWPGRMSASAVFRSRLPLIAAGFVLLRWKIISLKAALQKALSAGRSHQRSRTVSVVAFSGASNRCVRHS